MGFSFIDRITAIDADRAHGALRRPPGTPPLPSWVAIEAVGQLAAWIAMARCDFASRPVAALVGAVRMRDAESGGGIDLKARIERLDGRAILYSGTASVGDVDVAVLTRCVGPLLPMDGFDDPAAVRARLAALREGGAPPGAGGLEGDIPRLRVPAIELRAGAARAQLRVPESAPFFTDHFPRRPVFPASLLAEAFGQLAAPLAAQVLADTTERLRPAGVADFKVRSFSPPGQVLDLAADAGEANGDRAAVRVSATAEGRRVASAVLEFRRASTGAA